MFTLDQAFVTLQTSLTPFREVWANPSSPAPLPPASHVGAAANELDTLPGGVDGFVLHTKPSNPAPLPPASHVGAAANEIDTLPGGVEGNAL